MSRQRFAVQLEGLLQGIGFRPFVYRLAKRHHLAGWVANAGDGVVLEIEGQTLAIADFLDELKAQMPACGQLLSYQTQTLALTGQGDFYFAPSKALSTNSHFICPDIAVCAACVRELFDKHNRRYQHAFISCCHCGPRYSVIHALPYDRSQTSFADFALCARCLQEYQNPQDRRFFAQTLACHQCGPQLSFIDAAGVSAAQGSGAVQRAITALQAGQIIALKAVGGFQLMVDATNQNAVQRLRDCKQRPSKPFAVLVANIAQAQAVAELSALEIASLSASAAPIVLVKARRTPLIAPAVAPKQALLGIMLPSAPVQHLLLAGLNVPLVATSANREAEPMCIANNHAFAALHGIADGFLVHDRAILRVLDDSIVRVIANQPTVLRRARGIVPTPIRLNVPFLVNSLAVGGQQKSTVAIAHGQHIILSQHLGDLHALASVHLLENTVSDLTQMTSWQAQQVLHDSHHDYASTQYAQRLKLPCQAVQHHHAHGLACMAEHNLPPPVLAVVWDGTGLGADNTLWGGEFLSIHAQGFERVAHCRPFYLLGGAQAIKQPRRALLGLLYAWQGDKVFSDYRPLLTQFTPNELKLLQAALKNNINCPLTSSIGRLFDALASLLDICHENEFEGQAAMALEQCAQTAPISSAYYPLNIGNTTPFIIDWQALLIGVLADKSLLSVAQIAAKIHYSLAAAVFTVAAKLKIRPLVLSGGCFQNAFLVQAIMAHSLAAHYQILRHQNIPPNDGGLAVGQLYGQVLKQTAHGDELMLTN